MLGYFFTNPLRNPNLFHTQRIGNYICMIANPVNNWLCGKLFQFFTGECFTLIATCYIVTYRTVQKTVVSATSTTLTYKVR